MSHPGDGDALSFIVNKVDDPPIADSYAPLILVASQFLAPWRSRIFCQPQNSAVDPREKCVVQGV